MFQRLSHTVQQPRPWLARVIRLLLVAATVLLAARLIASLVVVGAAYLHPTPSLPSGNDFALYLERTRAWLSGDGYYLARQLTGSGYPVAIGDAMYPPTSLLLFVPFAVALPPVLWWAIPAVIVAAAVLHARPPLAAWPFLLYACSEPRFFTLVAYGNPSMWVIAAAAAGTQWRWPFVGALLKPTLAPFALLGVRGRSWWIALGIVVALSLPFGTMWLDWVTALVNARPTEAHGLDYLLGEWPVLVSMLAGLWISRRGASALG